MDALSVKLIFEFIDYIKETHERDFNIYFEADKIIYEWWENNTDNPNNCYKVRVSFTDEVDEVPNLRIDFFVYDIENKPLSLDIDFDSYYVLRKWLKVADEKIKESVGK